MENMPNKRCAKLRISGGMCTVRDSDMDIVSVPDMVMVWLGDNEIEPVVVIVTPSDFVGVGGGVMVGVIEFERVSEVGMVWVPVVSSDAEAVKVCDFCFVGDNDGSELLERVFVTSKEPDRVGVGIFEKVCQTVSVTVSVGEYVTLSVKVKLAVIILLLDLELLSESVTVCCFVKVPTVGDLDAEISCVREEVSVR